ncbi:polysaccharide deacetylase family protein [Saccharomonospora cyanea]|uniref:Putative xylanase/chitin deacetylase n=1 Tax=Saccharomonospora cyanea NA-134 TaxID=882082 RepID=H5XNR6_9PSEU|nr:polysaccharide deacetylase family protein [Saccharomonospora cyanea]EHR62123.1 putative xylanase/chitin deacetylase [Saccharomonospora cyanea NA-134]
MALRRILFLAAAASLVAGCTHTVAPEASPHETTGANVPTDPSTPLPDPEEVGANELGVVPVLMYHRIVPEPASVYDRTPEDFRAELQRLADSGYVPVTTAELATGRLDLPAGTHPVVLTFDDGDPSTIRMDGSRVAPDTAIGTLLDVARDNPGFRPTASVYVNEEPFGGGEAGRRALRWLVDNGFEVGNHTFGHADLGTSSPRAAQQAIADGDESIREAVPGYAPTTLALPFGARPEPGELALRGDGYDYRAVLLVGANPAPSPFSVEFDAAAVPRIRSQGPDGEGAEFGSTAWLDELAADPGSLYTSDGDPARISYPRDDDTLNPEFAEAAAPY